MSLSLRKFHTVARLVSAIHVLISKRSNPIPLTLFAWPLAVYRANYHDVYRANGMDAYFFVRFLRFMTLILLPIWFLTWAVLLPITSVKNHVSGHSGLDDLSFGNVTPDHKSRYAAHVIVAYAITGKFIFAPVFDTTRNSP
jgi:calcium permeable stress-gated cation channel